MITSREKGIDTTSYELHRNPNLSDRVSGKIPTRYVDIYGRDASIILCLAREKDFLV